jgi:hypothetical protein
MLFLHHIDYRKRDRNRNEFPNRSPTTLNVVFAMLGTAKSTVIYCAAREI